MLSVRVEGHDEQEFVKGMVSVLNERLMSLSPRGQATRGGVLKEIVVENVTLFRDVLSFMNGFRGIENASAANPGLEALEDLEDWVFCFR